MRVLVTPGRSSAKTWPVGGFSTSHTFAHFGSLVKQARGNLFAHFGRTDLVTKRRETLDDLLLRNGEAITAFAKRAGIPAFTMLRLRKGEIETPRIATLTRLAEALKLDVERVRDACAASRAAAEKG